MTQAADSIMRIKWKVCHKRRQTWQGKTRATIVIKKKRRESTVCLLPLLFLLLSDSTWAKFAVNIQKRKQMRGEEHEEGGEW